jgi:uncharacterized protein YuzE
MNLKYLPEIDTLYIYQDSRTPKILIQSKFDETVGIFVDKKTSRQQPRQIDQMAAKKWEI